MYAALSSCAERLFLRFEPMTLRSQMEQPYHCDKAHPQLSFEMSMLNNRFLEVPELSLCESLCLYLQWLVFTFFV